MKQKIKDEILKEVNFPLTRHGVFQEKILDKTCEAIELTNQKTLKEFSKRLKKKFEKNITVISKREFLNEIDKIKKELGGGE